MPAIVPPAPIVAPSAAVAKKWKCLRPVPGAFHDIYSRWSTIKENAAVCNCVNLASATSCACCKGERDPQLSAAVD